MLVISSAGPPSTEGVYVLANLSVARLSDTQQDAELLTGPFLGTVVEENTNSNPVGWLRDGLSLNMAKVVKIGHDPTITALAILDTDPAGHAEWRSTYETSPKVKPHDRLEIEWNEMYSLGVEDMKYAVYPRLDPGNYIFHVEEVDIYGQPTGVEAAVRLVVSPPFWKTTWFWGGVFLGCIVLMYAYGRYTIRQKMQQEKMRLKHQQALERERLRIAHDIHDDLGARVTQISLLSAMAQSNVDTLDKARAEFDQITKMSRELVTALYETIWAVSPENDNLYALGNYLCQIVNQLCERSQLSCRFQLSSLPRHIMASSQTRHNINLAVKEAVHNVIKHAGATEVTFSAEFSGQTLKLSVQDNGLGFLPAAVPPGHGLKNMKKRLADLGGDCVVVSRPGGGTSVQFNLDFK